MGFLHGDESTNSLTDLTPAPVFYVYAPASYPYLRCVSSGRRLVAILGVKPAASKKVGLAVNFFDFRENSRKKN